MWSATWPKEVESLAQDYLNTPTTVTVGSTELSANPDITQIIDYCRPVEKKPKYARVHSLALSSLWWWLLLRKNR
jgi:ATP-dependent RNA helicase DDX5/DBP2